MPLIMISGYAAESIRTDDIRTLGGEFLKKPFLPDALLAARGKVLCE